MILIKPQLNLSLDSTMAVLSFCECFLLFQVGFRTLILVRPVFDYNVDTYEALHERSPFAVNCICMVAARVLDGGGECSRRLLYGVLILASHRQT